MSTAARAASAAALDAAAAPDEPALLADTKSVFARLGRLAPLTPGASPRSRALRSELRATCRQGLTATLSLFNTSPKPSHAASAHAEDASRVPLTPSQLAPSQLARSQLAPSQLARSQLAPSQSVPSQSVPARLRRADTAPARVPATSPARAVTPPPAARAAADPRRKELAAGRAEAIADRIAEEPCTPLELLDIISRPRVGTRNAVEDEALALLCRGYGTVAEAEWKNALRSQPTTAANTDEMRTEAEQTAELATLEERLYTRHEVLARLNEGTRTAAWLPLVLKQIEVLLFAVDWNAKTGPGSGAFKRQFNKTTFCRRPALRATFAALDAAEREQRLQTEYKDELHQWKRRNEHLITARNRLLELYNSFGAAVLIDPIWNVDDLVLHRSPTFTLVYRSLARTVRESTVPVDGLSLALLAIRHEAASAVLTTSARQLGGWEDAEYISDFLYYNPPSALDSD